MCWLPPPRDAKRSGRRRPSGQHDLLQRRRDGLQQSPGLQSDEYVSLQQSYVRILKLSHSKDRKILDMLPDRPPEVTFSCDKDTDMCHFQFWTAQVESFYCSLDQCTSELRPGHEGSADTVIYDCNRIKCSCVPGRFLCGENGSIGA